MERPQAVAAGVGDLFRLLWGFLALNSRKTLFRLGKGKIRCPCQNPSDSGRALETSCDAVVTWSRPARFRRLCPLLHQMPDGEWRCSVNTADVRPFWGRAVAYLGGAVLSLYLAAVLLAFCFFRFVGYPVTFVAVGWPPAWHEIGRARARYFFDKAERAFAERRPGEGVMALSQSYQLDPSNYAVGLMLAQYAQAGWGEVSNQIYARLMHDHPKQRAETARIWFVALLANGDFPAIEKLAAERIGTDPAWLNALLFASRRANDTSVLTKLDHAAPGTIPVYVRQVCDLELQLRAANPAGRQLLLSQRLGPSAGPSLAYYWIDRELDAGRIDDALFFLDKFGGRLDPRDHITLMLEVYQAEGWQSIVRGRVERELMARTNAPLVELISAFLIRHPDPVILEKLFASVYAQPLPPKSDLLGAFTSLFCAAGVAGDWVRLQASAAELKSVTGSQFTALDIAEAYFRDATQPRVSLSRCLRSLPGLPIEVTYALYDYADQQKQ